MPAGTVAADIVSLPPPPFTTRASFAPSDAVMFHQSLQAGDRDGRSRSQYAEDIVAVRPVHGHGVGLPVAGTAANCAGEIDVDLA